MKIIEPSYEIWDCPDGEAVLAKIERIGRICYKSEDKITEGTWRACPECGGTKQLVPKVQTMTEWRALGAPVRCPHCNSDGMVQDQEPSSHAFMRMILRINRRAAVTKRFMETQDLRGSDRLDDNEAIEEFVRSVVDYTLDDYRDDPPHDGLLEHASVTVHFTVSRGFTHELVRHRHGSYAQECVAGSTKVTKKYTIKELFERQASQYGKTHNKTIRLRSCGEDGTIIRNKIAAVMYKGEQPTQRVTTKLGYVIEATGNHEFMLPDGSFACLGELDVGDYVMVNGRPSLLHVSDKDLRDCYLSEQLAPQEIADRFGAPYRSVLNRLKGLGIFQKHLNDKDLAKYNKNHSQASYEKMRGAILVQYQHGRQVWNKGLHEGDHPSVDSQARSLRANHHDNQPGTDNSSWKGGVSQGYYARKVPKGPCELCMRPNAEHVHHVDRNRRNNADDNLMRVCVNCHDKLHHGWHVGVVAHPDEIAAIDYVGEQDVYDIEMAAPYPNYVANGFVVHNSTRYCNYSKGKFGSSITVIKRSFELEEQIEAWMHGVGEVEHDYMELIKLGVKPEIARDLLTQATKASITLTANFNSLRNFFRKRCSPRAHPDMRSLMTALRDDLRKRIPIVFDELI